MTGFQKHLAMWGVLGVVVLLVGVWVADFNSDQPAPIALDDATAETFITLDEQVHFVCSHCHAYPQPETLPRRAWHKELRIAYGFIGKSDLDPSLVPELDHVVDYYESRAPDALPFPTVLESDQTPPRIFVERPLSGLSDVFYQGVAHVEWFASAEPASFAPGLACDMRNGHILTWNSLSNTPTVRLLAEVGHPVHAVPCDLDGDGNGDLIVADIGSIMPTNEKTGRVVWLRTTVDGNHEPIVLAENLGRVADVRVADFDADGDHDLIVAVFGWHRNGQLLYLENNTRDYQQPQFHANMLDDRTGAIHVPITDLNNDGLPDFVALLSQEHEQVLAFLNMGNGEFRRELLFDAGNPSYGSSGIRLADLDQDGDVDVLLCNGDTLDLTIYKPYHSVQWLENEGGFPFRHHHLAQLPGAFQTVLGPLVFGSAS